MTTLAVSGIRRQIVPDTRSSCSRWMLCHRSWSASDWREAYESQPSAVFTSCANVGKWQLHADYTTATKCRHFARVLWTLVCRSCFACCSISLQAEHASNQTFILSV